MRRHSEGVFPIDSLDWPGTPWPVHWSAEQVAAKLGPFINAERRTRLATIAAQRLNSVTVVLDAPHDPHNGAAILRSCEAFGISRLHVIARVEPFLVARSVTRGTEYWVDVSVHPAPNSAIQSLQQAGYTLVTTHPEGQLIPTDLAHISKLALVLGNERTGVCPALAQSAEHSVRIPMRGFVESLNLSVAAAILLSAATQNRPGDLSPTEQHYFYARGLYRSINRAAEILAALEEG